MATQPHQRLEERKPSLSLAHPFAFPSSSSSSSSFSTTAGTYSSSSSSTSSSTTCRQYVYKPLKRKPSTDQETAPNAKQSGATAHLVEATFGTSALTRQHQQAKRAALLRKQAAGVAAGDGTDAGAHEGAVGEGGGEEAEAEAEEYDPNPSILWLPDEILKMIILMCPDPIKALVSFSMACQRTAAVCDDYVLWREALHLFERKHGIPHVLCFDAAAEWKEQCKERHIYARRKRICTICFTPTPQVKTIASVFQILCTACEEHQLISQFFITRDYSLSREAIEAIDLPCCVTGRGTSYCRKHIERYIRGAFGPDRLEMLATMRTVKNERLARNREHKAQDRRRKLAAQVMAFGFKEAEVDVVLAGGEHMSAALRAEVQALLEGHRTYLNGMRYMVRDMALVARSVATALARSIRTAALKALLVKHHGVTEAQSGALVRMIETQPSKHYIVPGMAPLVGFVLATQYVPGDAVLGQLRALVASIVNPTGAGLVPALAQHVPQ